MKPPFVPHRKVGKLPLVLVLLVLAALLVFVSYPIENIYMGGRLTPVRTKADPPKKGAVGYLRVDEGYGIFAAGDPESIHLWERTVSDPSGLRAARELLDSGRIVSLMPNTSVLSVDPARGTMKILSGSSFGKILYVSLIHVRFVPLSP